MGRLTSQVIGFGSSLRGHLVQSEEKPNPLSPAGLLCGLQTRLIHPQNVGDIHQFSGRIASHPVNEAIAQRAESVRQPSFSPSQ